MPDRNSQSEAPRVAEPIRMPFGRAPFGKSGLSKPAEPKPDAGDAR
jgi:hypothetical protein